MNKISSYSTKIITILVLSLTLTTSLIACGDKGYNGNEKAYATHLLYNYYQTQTSSRNACILAKEMSPLASTWLQVNVPSGSLANTTKQIYNKLYSGSYYKKLRNLLVADAKGAVGNSAITGASKLWTVIKSVKKSKRSMYFFQLTVIAPYAYNVVKDRKWVKTSKRYYPNGKVKSGCGYLVCR